MAVCELDQDGHRHAAYMFAHLRQAHPEIWTDITENRLIDDPDVIAHELSTAADRVDMSLHPADDPAIAHLVAIARIAAASIVPRGLKV